MHTPAPWNLGAVTVIDTATGKMVLDEESGYVTIGDNDDGDSACEVHVEGENAAANARLIAAAPELLATLEDVLMWLGQDAERWGAHIATVRAAIAKAQP